MTPADKLQDKEPKYCPTQSGTFTGYYAEWRTTRVIMGVSSEWKRVKIKDVGDGNGIPYPSQFKGILHTIGMSGYHQAMALGHTFAAFFEANGEDGVEIRAVPYAIAYNIKAEKIEEEE